MSIDWADYLPDSLFVGVAFIETASIKRIHSFPRLGHPSDISFIASENVEIRNQYFKGAIFVSVVILLIYIVWNIMLLLFRFLGPDRYGILSGYPPLLLPPSEKTLLSHCNGRIDNNLHSGEESEEENAMQEETSREIEEWQSEYQTAKSQIKWVRICFLISASFIMIFSFVIYASGLVPLEEAFTASKDEVVDLQSLIIATRDQMDHQYLASESIIPKRDIVLENIMNWCPNVETNFTVSVDDLSKVDGDIVLDSDGNYVAQVDNLRASLALSYFSLDNMISDGAQTISKSLDTASKNAQDVEDGFNRFLFWYGLSMFFIVAIDLLTIALLGGVYVASRSNPSAKAANIMTNILIPTFTIFMILSWVTTAIFGAVSIFSADVCTGSPELNIVAVFHEKEQTMDPLLYAMTKYYVEDCMSKPVSENLKPTLFLDDFRKYVDDAVVTTNKFLNEISFVDSLVMDSTCGESISGFANNLTTFLSELKQFDQTVSTSSSSLYCSVFTPTYADIMHDQVCYKGVDSLGVIFVTLLLISICGMIMITFRVALRGIEYYDEDTVDEDYMVDAEHELALEASLDGHDIEEIEHSKHGLVADSDPYQMLGVSTVTSNEIEVSMINDQPYTKTNNDHNGHSSPRKDNGNTEMAKIF